MSQSAENLFGTDGIRCQVGISPLTYDSLPLLGKAVGQWVYTKYGSKARILLGHDTRASVDFIKTSLQAGLLTYPLSVFDAQVISTPAICYLTQKNNLFDVGIIVSASHNPFQDNGIKIVDRLSGKLSLDDERAISRLFYNFSQMKPITSYTTLGSTTYFTQAVDSYIKHCSSFFPSDLLSGLTVAIDCANGALSTIAPAIFSKLGASLISIHNEPNGININDTCGALYPEQVQKAVLAHNADVGFAFDGDGDRVIAVSRNGIIKNGDDILALLIHHPVYQASSFIVGTEMSNYGFEQFLTKQNKKLVRTPVGDKYIAQTLEQTHGLIGGEQSGHIILRDYLASGDGIFTALRLIQALKQTNNWDMESFEKFPQVHVNVTIQEKKDLKKDPFASIIAQSNTQLKSGRLVVRYSGTENILRIMVEDEEFEHAQDIGNSLARVLAQFL